MASYVCPFCEHTFKLDERTHSVDSSQFSYHDDKGKYQWDHDYSLNVDFYKCPNCDVISSKLEYSGSKLPEKTFNIFPPNSAKRFPSYIPMSIRQDYEEAYSILDLSPKASATLSRRCIQGMIHDKWKIKLKNLNQEITALMDKIDPSLWSAINSLRELGNIGAHMEKDINIIVEIDAGEAEKLLKLVEILFKEWYIVPHERNELLSNIVQINTEKQNQRKKPE